MPKWPSLPRVDVHRANQASVDGASGPKTDASCFWACFAVDWTFGSETKGLTEMAGRGFASMNKERVREIASMGGVAAHAQGKAHVFTSEEAQKAGRKGGLKTSSDRQHMAELGRKGGKVCGARRAKK